MKKFYNLLAIMLLSIFCLGMQSVMAQGPIFAENFDAITGSGTQQCEASVDELSIEAALPGWTGYKVYPANGKVKLGTGSVDGWIQTPSIDLSNYGTVCIRFDAKAWNVNNNPNIGTTITVYVNSTAYTVEGLPNVGTTDTTAEGFCVMGHFEIIAAAGAPVTIRFEGNPRIFLDNITIIPPTDGNFAAISVQGNTTFNNLGVNETATTNLVARGFNLNPETSTTLTLTGDSQFTTTTTTISNDVLMGETGAIIPVSFVATEVGTYAATLTLSNSDMENPTNVALWATVINVQDIPSIDQLRALIDNSDWAANTTDSVFYKYTGHAYVTQVFNPNNNCIQNKWIQDETGAIELYDANCYLTNVASGQEVTNLIGKLSNYYGNTEFKAEATVANADINAFPTNIPTPITLTIAQLQDQDYMDNIQGQLVELKNVTFNEAGVFTKFIRYTVNQDNATDTSIYITSSYDPQCGADIPTGAVDVIGVTMRAAAYSNGSNTPRVASRYYVIPREIVAHGTGIADNEMENVKVYPNPFEDNFVVESAENITSVAVYNAFGQMVASQSVSAGANTINTANLAAGMYIVKVYNDNQVVGFAKVVKK